MMILALAVVLLILMLAIGGKRGLRSYISLFANILIILLIVYSVSKGMPPFFAAVIGCMLINVLTLIFNNGLNIKTLSSAVSVIAVLAVMGVLSVVIAGGANIGGFSPEEYAAICGYSFNIGINMPDVAVLVVLVGAAGAMIDTSIAISSFLNEAHLHNPAQTMRELYLSGMNVGRDLLGTTTNTLYFAFLGGFTTLLIWFKLYSYSAGKIINSNVFSQEFIRIICSGLSCVLVMPVTSIITSYILTKTGGEAMIKRFKDRAAELFREWLRL